MLPPQPELRRRDQTLAKRCLKLYRNPYYLSSNTPNWPEPVSIESEFWKRIDPLFVAPVKQKLCNPLIGCAK